MRPSTIAPVILAALVCIFGCGGGGSNAVTPDPSGQVKGPGRQVAQTAVEGDVLLNGAFIADATVVAYDLSTGLELDRTASDSDGHYILDLPSREVGIWVTSPQGSAGPAWVNVPDKSQTSLQDFTLTGGTAGLLIGRAVDTKHGEPVSGAKVSFGGREVATDGFGFYSFHSVGSTPSGRVMIEAPGFGSADLELRSGQVSRDELLNTAFFTVKPNSDTASSLGGVLRDITNGNPVGGAILTLSRPIDPSFTPIRRQTNLGGVWRFYNIPAGSYSLEIRRDGFLTQTASAVINTRDGVLNLFLDPDPAGRATIQGTVFSFNGTTPLNNCSVVASSGAYGSISATSTSSGSFTLQNVVVDTPYTLIFTPTAALNQTLKLTVSVPASGLLLQISLPEETTGAINGRVTKTGQTTPPVGAVVEAEKVGEPQSGQVFRTAVDANGNFGLNGLPAGRYKVRASYVSPTGPVNLSVTGSTDVIAGQITKRNLTFP